MPLPLPVEHLIMEGVRRIDEWGRIRDRIPSTDMVVKFVEQPGEKAKGVNLAPEEWRVFARINGKDTLAEIAQKTGLSEFDVCRIVYGFIQAGLVEVAKPQIAFGVSTRPQEGVAAVQAAAAGSPTTTGASNGRSMGPDVPARTAAPSQAFVPPKRGLIYRLIERIRRI